MSDVGIAQNVAPPSAAVLGKECRLEVEGKGNSASFRAGQRVSIEYGDVVSAPEEYLLLSVRHHGGWKDGAYTYRNEFSGIRTEPEIYAPPLRTPVPHIDGVTTASVGATGDHHPTLNEYGNYNVSMPYILKEKQSGSGQNSIDYGKSKHIRLAQPSGGMCGDKPYGIHFPSKRGAEMVMAYIEGDPSRPLGLGFVPNGSSPSVVNNLNTTENVMRSWGGNELVMTDTAGDKKVRLTTPEARYLELYDGKKLVRLKSEHCEIQLNNEKQYAEIDAGGHKIHINYKEDKNAISITTLNGNEIKMDDPDGIISIQNASEEDGKAINTMVLDGKNKAITIDSMDNAVVIDGKDNRITMESAGSKFTVDGQNNKIALESDDSELAVDGDGNSVILDTATITLSAKQNIIIRAGGKINLDAKEGIFNRSMMIDLDQGGTDGADNALGAVNVKKGQNNAKMKDNIVPPIATSAELPNRNENPTGESQVSSDNDDDVLDAPQVTEIYWSYGEKYTRLTDKSRFYNDVNLHVKTANYKDGDNVNITLKREDGESLFGTTRTLELNGPVYNNEAVFKNVFEEHTLNI